MTSRVVLLSIFGACLLACGASRPVTIARVPSPSLDQHEPSNDEPSTTATTVAPSPEPATPTNASYEKALSTPEPIDVNDDRAHLTDNQLTGPVRGVLNGCRVPSNARVTVRTAVQFGRAIGVTVSVRFERPKGVRAPMGFALRAEQKTSARIVACVDKAVRAQSWPPSRRRDSFVTEF